MEQEKEKKGIGLKVFGISLFFIGSLNMLLCWRGGLTIYSFYPASMAAGAAIFIFGTIRGMNN